ncbi:MAG: carboxypeptidase regulatory-like domain-containing protein [Candidatus Hydrogenedentes bacterium]|nr:carboxypeptidase regulatory-like domain-containing protein [Candidatus Hydrogenedentota bacterium]
MDQPADGAAQWGSASTSTTEGEIRFDEPVQVDGKTRVVAAHTIRNSDFRIAALDTSGKEIPLSSEGVFGGSPKLGMLSNTFAAPLTNIKTILFQARILEWVTFKDVPLAPSSAASKSEANKIPLTQSPDTISPGGPAKVESFLRAALEASQGMLKKKVTVSWPDTTLSAAIDTLAKEADFNIVVDSREGKNNAPVQAASFDYQPLVSVLVALLRPTKLEFTVQPGYIWLSSPLLIRKETYGELETRHYSIPAPTQEGLQKLLELLDKSAPAVTDPNTGSRLSYVQILDEDSGIITAYNTPENLDALEKLLPAPTDQESMTKADTSQSSAGFIALPPSNPSSIKVTGCVTDTQGNPLENVTVTALRSSGSTAFGIGKAVTNASGRYALNLPDGNSGAGGWPAFPVAVAFVPSRDGWFEARRWEQGSPYGATERPKPDNEWNVAPAKVLTPREAPYAIDFVMESGAVISGRIREPDGSPYTQDLTLTWERQPSRWDAFVTIDPDEAGRFRCTAPVGNVWLTRGPDTSYGPVALRAPGNYKADLTLDEGAHPSKLTGDIAPDTVEAALTGLSSELAPRISRDDASGFELHVTDGTHPAAGAHVVLAKPGWELRFEEGEFKEAYDHNKLGNAPSVKTGADGKCILPAMEGPFMLAVVHPAGYAICGCDEALAKGTLVLTPWAILQGTLRLSDVLCPDMKLQIQSSLEFDCIGKPLIRPASNAADAIAVNFHALARTDAAARFESKHLPAGHATLSPAFPTGEKDGLAPVVGLQGSVALESGKTTKYDFGESRSTVTGKFDPSQTPMDWSAVKATLRLEAPHIGLDGDNILWKSQGDFAKSPMGKLYNRPITIYSDGTFCLDEVPEGRYQLIAFGPSGSNYASSKFSLPPTGAKPETTGPLSINLTGPSAPRLFPEFSFQAKEVTNPGGATQLKGDVKCTFGETSVTADQAEFGKSMRKFTFTGAVTLTTKAPDGKTLTTHSDHCEIDSDYKAHFTGNVSLDSEKGKGETKSLTLDLRTGEFQMDGPSAGAAQIESNAPAASAPEGAQSTIEQALAKTVSLKMEHIHLTEVAEFLTRQLGVKIVVDSAVVAPPGAPKEGSPITRYVSDGAVSYIDLKDVTLKEALKALTRPMRLGFTVSGDTITITTPSQTADRYKNALDNRSENAGESRLPR